MNTHTLRCTACSRDHTPDMRTLQCKACASPLVVAYPPDAEPRLNAPPVSLGEGNTPVVPLPTIADSLGLTSLYAKLEFSAPTGSFKDRGTAVMLSVAREFGVDEIVEDSSGNAGASVAAYAARCGIKAHVFAPDSAPETKLRQIKVYGAELHLVPGPREAAAEAALAFCENTTSSTPPTTSAPTSWRAQRPSPTSFPQTSRTSSQTTSSCPLATAHSSWARGSAYENCSAAALSTPS